MTIYEPDELLARNRRWARLKTTQDPSFFRKLLGQQRPRYFWLGCSDSRVPATEIVDVEPGAIFVHRNVSNLAVHGDPSFEAALTYAVDVIEVGHVIVTGHYGCGGVCAAMNPAPGADPAVTAWLAPIRDLKEKHAAGLSALSAPAQERRLCELNVRAQADYLCRHPVLVRARRGPVLVHSWIYDIGHGVIAPLNAAQEAGAS